jgi:outer membrane protein assembly factor BamB
MERPATHHRRPNERSSDGLPQTSLRKPANSGLTERDTPPIPAKTAGCLAALLGGVLLCSAAEWNQFRGPNASGVSNSTRIPVEFDPDTNVVWKTSLPGGHSSPSIGTDRVFVTSVEDEKLYTIAVDRGSGRILWRREAPRPRRQVIERPANGPASATPATDGKNVYVFFQDFGLLAYGPDGNELWRMPLGPFNNPFGHGSSPILADNTLLMAVDQDTNSFLLAIDKQSGKVRWRTERAHAQRGYSTPVLYQAPGGLRQVIVAGSYRLSGYDVATGKEQWWIRRLPWQIKPTPVIGDGIVFFSTWAGESEPGEQEHVPPFREALGKLDLNKDGKLGKDEITDPRAKARFDEYLDLDDSGFLEERDWVQFQERRLGENGLRAYRLGGEGDLTESNGLWKHSKTLPNVPSPLLYRGVLYLLKEGGILTSLDAKTGRVLKQARLTGALGDYYASPVAADGKIYTVSEEGKAAVIQAQPEWQILRINDLREPCKATPAIADGDLYVRTAGSLYCFRSGK